MASSAKARAKKKATGLRNKRSLGCIITRNLQCDKPSIEYKGGFSIPVIINVAVPLSIALCELHY